MSDLWLAELNELTARPDWERLSKGASIGLSLEPVCENQEADFGAKLVGQLNRLMPGRIFEVADAVGGSRQVSVIRVS